MALRMGALYDALVSGNIPVEQARSASEEVAELDDRMGRVERDLTIVKWMVGTNIALTVLVLGAIVSIAARLIQLP